MFMTRRRILSGLVLTLTLTTGFLAGHASAAQPRMRAALDHLRSAKSDLERADADKGGHRTRALELVNSAISQVEQGMSYDRRH
jgi:hypothetical protein